MRKNQQNHLVFYDASLWPEIQRKVLLRNVKLYFFFSVF